MKITIHRGTHQIGGCVTEYEHEGWHLFVDYGEELPGGPKSGDLFVEGLTHGDLSKSALLITHNHGDHIGRITMLPKDLPIYMGKVGRAIQMQLSRYLKNVDSKHEEMLERLSPSNPFLNVFEAGKPFSFGPFIIMPVTLDHSAFEAFAFKIEVEGHSTFHTGDFRTHGFRSKKFPELISKFVGTVDCVVCEATNVLRHDAAVLSERDLQCQFEDAFKANPYNIVYVASTNIDRLFSLYHAAVKAQRLFLMDRYQKHMMDLVVESGSIWEKSELYNFKVESKPMVLEYENKEFRVNDKFKRKLAQKGYVLLARPNSLFDNLVERIPGEKKKYLSMWEGYVTEDSEAYNEKLAQSLGENYIFMHTSGHCDMNSMHELFNMLQPKTIIPIHTDAPNEFENIFGNKWRVVILNDGESIEC